MTLIAHGLAVRSDLPIPEWLFGWAAAMVLFVSFVALAVAVAGAEAPGGGAGGPFRAALNRVLSSRRWTILLRARSACSSSASCCGRGFKGTQTPAANFAPTFVVRDLLARAGAG